MPQEYENYGFFEEIGIPHVNHEEHGHIPLGENFYFKGRENLNYKKIDYEAFFRKTLPDLKPLIEQTALHTDYIAEKYRRAEMFGAALRLNPATRALLDHHDRRETDRPLRQRGQRPIFEFPIFEYLEQKQEIGAMALDATVELVNEPIVIPTPDKEQSTGWLLDNASCIPKGWNRRRLGLLIKSRLKAGLDKDVHDATYWFRNFECPETKDGVTYYSEVAETAMILALLFGQNPEKLPSNPERIAKLFHFESIAATYLAIHEDLTMHDGNNIESILADKTSGDLRNVRRTLDDCKKFGLRLTPDQQTQFLNNLRQMSQRREAFINDAQTWLQTHSTTPRDLLVTAWKHRDQALARGIADNPSAIKAWIDSNQVVVRLLEMSTYGSAPENFSEEDLVRLEPYMQEISRHYGPDVVIRTLAKHKEIFNPDALLPASVLQLSDGWHAEILNKDDPRGYTIGNDTGCCMTIVGGSRECITAGYSDPRYSFMALYDKEGRIAAQSLLYVNEEIDPNTIVIDNIETNTGRNRDIIADRYAEFFSLYLSDPAADRFTRVHLGVHPSEKYQNFVYTDSIPTPINGLYTDSYKQLLLYDKELADSRLSMSFMRPEDQPKLDKLESRIYGESKAFETSHDIEQIYEDSPYEQYTFFINADDSPDAIGYLIAYVDDAQEYVPFSNHKKVLYIDDLAFVEEYQGRGYGKKALAYLTRVANELNLPIVFHARNATTWQIFSSGAVKPEDYGYTMRVLSEDEDYYSPQDGAHLVILEKI